MTDQELSVLRTVGEAAMSSANASQRLTEVVADLPPNVRQAVREGMASHRATLAPQAYVGVFLAAFLGVIVAVGACR